MFSPVIATKEAIPVVACAWIASYLAMTGTSRKDGVCFVIANEVKQSRLHGGWIASFLAMTGAE
jgi:hypothetical protein